MITLSSSAIALDSKCGLIAKDLDISCSKIRPTGFAEVIDTISNVLISEAHFHDICCSRRY